MQRSEMGVEGLTMRRLAERLLWCGLLIPVIGLDQGLWAQTPTADEIVARMMARDQEQHAALEHYGSRRTYRLFYRGPIGERSAEVQAQMDFSAPDQKHFTVVSETGSQIFCHKILRRLMEGEQQGALEVNRLQSTLSPENDTFKLVGEDEVDGVKFWVLEVSPKVDNRFAYKGRVWISMDDYATVRIVGSPAKNPTWLMGAATFDYRYARQGQFWLPQRNTTVSHLRIGGQVTLTVDYGTYEIIAATVHPLVAIAP